MSGRRSDAAAGECVLAERRERLKNMYYTIEGKRFLCILYIAGLLFGSLFINLSIRMELFRTTDFLGFTEYIRSMEGLDTGAFFSYVCLVRFRQLLIFFSVSFSLFSLCGVLHPGFSGVHPSGVFHFHSGSLLWMGGNDQRHRIFASTLSFLRNFVMCDLYLSFSEDAFVKNVHVFRGEKIFLCKKWKNI